MPIKSKGYDPDLGRKFFEDHGGLILGGSAAQASTGADVTDDDYAYFPTSPYMDAQQQHDEMLLERLNTKPRQPKNRAG